MALANEAEWAELTARRLVELRVEVRTTDDKTAFLVSKVTRELLGDAGEFMVAVMAARDAMQWVDDQGATPSHVEGVFLRTGPETWEPRRYPVPAVRAAWMEADIARCVAPHLAVWPN